MAILRAHANVLGYRPGEEFEVDLDEPAEAAILRPYLVGRFVEVVPEGDPPPDPDGMTVAELRDLAEQRGWALRPGRRADLVAQVRAALIRDAAGLDA